MKTIILLSFLLLTTALGAQTTIRGRVIDAESQAPIPYVNIGVKRLATGTVSDEQGVFSLVLKQAEELITFSAIGYQAREISGMAWKDGQAVELSRRAYELEQVEVKARQFNGPEKIFGARNDTRGLSIGFGSRQLGAQIGAIIPIDRPTYVKSANFVLNHAKSDSMLFRVNIYTFQGGEAGDNLLRENVLIHSRQQKGTITVDLTPYDLVLEQDALLSLEWVRDDGKEGNLGITFDTKKGKKGKGVYLKNSSIGAFSKLGYKTAYKPCFYFVGRQVD